MQITMDRTTRLEEHLGDAETIAYDRLHLSVLGHSGVAIESEKPLIRVGASSDNDLVIPDPSVSRAHVEIQREGKGAYVIRDLSSTNGTHVGAVRVREATICGKTEVRLGRAILVIEPRTVEVVAPASPKDRCGELVGASLPMRKVYGVIERVAPAGLPVLIMGETGTGKELCARAIHEKSARADGPFVTLDCSALPPTLVESALFGHEKGAFTGADRSHAGVFERADGGTLFLDELGELPLDLQPKLLRALERGEIERIRGEQRIRVDVRVVAATNRDLSAMVRDGRFRSDLFYRLAVVTVRLPPLRDRLEDIPSITRNFFETHRAELDKAGARANGVAPEAMARLLGATYPGNVRELINTLRRAAVFAQGHEILAGELEGVEETPAAPPAEPRLDSTPDLKLEPRTTFASLKEAKAILIDRFEREYLVGLLDKHANNISRAAREAGIGRRHLHRLVERYQIHLRTRPKRETAQ
jgi:transcriptional regulator with GAF, ATPase, and Fis domain